MKTRLFTVALGAAAMAASGCAYQQSSPYGHSAYPTSYGTHTQTSYQPYGYRQATVGGTRIELEASYEQFVDGNIIDGDAIGIVNYNEVGYKDAYKPGYRLAAGLARDVSPNTAISARGFYKTAEAEDTFAVGTSGGGNVNAAFTDYESYGAELGLRQYLGPKIPSRMRPFVGASLGAAYVDDINLTGPVAGPLNEGGWVPTASGTAGLELPVSPTASFAVESGLRWTGSMDRTAAASAAGFSDDEAKLSVPITLRGSFRF